jgi:zinc resistance-associated protein
MWKTLIAGTAMLMIAGSTLAFAQQPTPAERSQRAQLTADDIAAFADARIAALDALQGSVRMLQSACAIVRMH